MKNKLLLFFISFILIGLYVITNIFLFNYQCNDNVVEDFLNKTLKNDLELLSEEKNIKYEGYNLIGAQCVERNVYAFFDQIIINRGLEDGVKEKDAVINKDGLVGVISKAYNNYSEVSLISNKDFKISVKINESYAIYNNGLISNIIDYKEIKDGDDIYTSGLTNIPKDIYIGKISEFYQNNLTAKILLNDLKNLKFVYVIIGDK